MRPLTPDSLLAHQRLMETLPRERIRTHEARQFHEPERIGAPPAHVSANRREMIAKLYGTINPETGLPWRQREVAKIMGITIQSVRKHLRVLGGKPYNWGKKCRALAR